MLSKFKSQIPKLMRNNKFSKIYLVLLLAITNIYLIASALFYRSNLVASYFVSIFLFIFLFTNTQKKLNAEKLDDGVMIHPFDGMPIHLLLEGPGVFIKTTQQTTSVPVSLITWLYVCVYAISKSSKKQFEYHQYLVSTVSSQCPDLMPWIPEMYKELNTTPPLPDEMSMEDFNES
jgi:hypothetical protein